MKKHLVSAVVAHDKNRGIGKNGKMPWHIPEDLQHFKKTTDGGVVIMGRKTYESLGKYKPLPNRINIVITRDEDYANKEVGCVVTGSIEEAIKKAHEYDKEIYIIGGGEIYKQAMKYTDKLVITLIEKEYDCDTFFPEYPEFGKVIKETEGENGECKFLEIIRG